MRGLLTEFWELDNLIEASVAVITIARSFIYAIKTGALAPHCAARAFCMIASKEPLIHSIRITAIIPAFIGKTLAQD
jgi:hypothetical protein